MYGGWKLGPSGSGSSGTSQKSRWKERHRVVDVVLGQQRPLHLNKVLRVAQVRGQFQADLALGLTVPGKVFIQADSTGSFSSWAYSVTVPS